MNKLAESIYQNLIKPNEGYLFLFKDDVYIPIYRNELLITKRETVKLDIVQEKILQIINIGILRVDEISRILGLERRILEVTIADLTTLDLISVTSDACRLLQKGHEALKTLERTEKKQDKLQDVYIEGVSGNILKNITEYPIQDKVNNDDNKVRANILSDDLVAIKKQFPAVKELFDLQFSNVEIAEGLTSAQQELLTIDNIERTYVQFIRIPICVFVNSNGPDIDITAFNGKQNDILGFFKGEIIKQINQRIVLRNHFGKKRLKDVYLGSRKEEIPTYRDKIRKYYFSPKSNMKNNEIEQMILSDRMLIDDEKDVLIRYLADMAENIELIVDNLDDWAYSSKFIGSLNWILGGSHLKIIYSESRDIKKAKEKIKKSGLTDIVYEQRDEKYYICWVFDNHYRIYALPEIINAIDEHTTTVIAKYYLQNI